MIGEERYGSYIYIYGGIPLLILISISTEVFSSNSYIYIYDTSVDVRNSEQFDYKQETRLVVCTKDSQLSLSYLPDSTESRTQSYP